MTFIDERVGVELRKAFGALASPVRLVAFAQPEDSPHSEAVPKLLAELAALDERLSCEPRSLAGDAELAAALGIERVPAVAVIGARDFGVRFYGLPGGYEFGTLVEAVLDVSRGESGLSAETRVALAAVDHPLRIRVFSTPT